MIKSFIFTGLLLTLSLCTPAYAQSNNCVPRGLFLKTMETNGSEVVNYDVTDEDTVVELWANKRTKAWFFVITSSGGNLTCPIAYGGNYGVLDLDKAVES